MRDLLPLVVERVRCARGLEAVDSEREQARSSEGRRLGLRRCREHLCGRVVNNGHALHAHAQVNVHSGELEEEGVAQEGGLARCTQVHACHLQHVAQQSGDVRVLLLGVGALQHTEELLLLVRGQRVRPEALQNARDNLGGRGGAG